MKRFTFNDGTKNSYGFRVATAGINLERFKKNPVMLNSHFNHTDAVIGKWDDIRVEDGKLSAVPVFDDQDDEALKIKGKVERGFINGASMGIKFHRNDMKYLDGELVLETSELYEASIVAVPSNQNAIQLIDAESGEYLKDEQIEQICLSAAKANQPTKPKPKSEIMKKILLSATIWALLGLETGKEVEPGELEAKINQLHAEKEAAELKLSAKIKQEEQAKLSAIEQKVKQAITDGKFSADQETDLINLGVANESLLDSTLKAVSKKASLSAAIVTKPNQEPKQIESMEDFQKLSLTEQLDFKAENPEAYKQIVKQLN